MTKTDCKNIVHLSANTIFYFRSISHIFPINTKFVLIVNILFNNDFTYQRSSTQPLCRPRRNVNDCPYKSIENESFGSNNDCFFYHNIIT